MEICLFGNSDVHIFLLPLLRPFRSRGVLVQSLFLPELRDTPNSHRCPLGEPLLTVRKFTPS